MRLECRTRTPVICNRFCCSRIILDSTNVHIAAAAECSGRGKSHCQELAAHLSDHLDLDHLEAYIAVGVNICLAVLDGRPLGLVIDQCAVSRVVSLDFRRYILAGADRPIIGRHQAGDRSGVAPKLAPTRDSNSTSVLIMNSVQARMQPSGAEGGNRSPGLPDSARGCLLNSLGPIRDCNQCPDTPGSASGLLQELLQKTEAHYVWAGPWQGT